MAQTSRACLSCLASFDTRSVLLFAALSLGGVAALHAQPQPSAGSTTPGASQRAPRAVMGPGPSSAQPGSAGMNASDTASKAAFDRADTNHDGQLSPTEAAALPAIGNRFEELDTDRNGMLSNAEFHEGVKP